MDLGHPGIDEFDAGLAPFLVVMGRKTRRTSATLQLHGLLDPGDRRCLQPVATRLGLAGHDPLQHVIASPAWEDGPLWEELGRRADRLVGGPDARLVIGDTALPKESMHSVGVACRYCGAVDRQANSQSLVSLTLAQAEKPAPVGLRLFPPEA